MLGGHIPFEAPSTPRLPNPAGSGAFHFACFACSDCVPSRPFRVEPDGTGIERTAPAGDASARSVHPSVRTFARSHAARRRPHAPAAPHVPFPKVPELPIPKKADGDASIRSTPVGSETREEGFKCLLTFSTFSRFERSQRSQRSATIGITRGRFTASRFAKDFIGTARGNLRLQSREESRAPNNITMWYNSNYG